MRYLRFRQPVSHRRLPSSRAFANTAVAPALVLAAFLALPAEPAHAQHRAAAEALFQDGHRAAEASDYATACEKFEASNRLEPAAGTVLNIANCKEELGEIASAWQRYLEAADKLPADDERAKYARERAEALEPRLPRAVLVAAGELPDGSVVSRDGQPIPLQTLGTALPVDPGTHEYTLEVPGHETSTQSIQIAEGQVLTVTLTIGPKLPPAPASDRGPAPENTSSTAAVPMTTPADDAFTPQRTWGFVTLGVGALGIGVGTVTGLMALDRKDTVDELCRDDFCRSDEGTNAASSGQTLSLVSTVAFAAGAVGVGAGLYLLLSDDGTQEQVGLQVTPTVGGAALGIGGRL